MDPSRNVEWTDRHGDLIRRAAPEVPAFEEAERDLLWRRIQAAAGSRSPRRNRWRLVVAGVAAASVVGIAGAATAAVLSAHTGKGPVDAEDVELGGPGERLDPAASDFPSVLDDETRDIRFPTAQARDRALAWEVRSLVSGDALVSTGAVRYWMAGHAVCAWTDIWAVAVRSDDTATQHQAAAVILGAHDWTSFTDVAPDLPYSELAFLRGVERAVQVADPSVARAALWNNQACLPGLAPDLGMGTSP